MSFSISIAIIISTLTSQNKPKLIFNSHIHTYTYTLHSAQEALLPVLGRLANAPADPLSGSPGLGLVLPLLPKSFRILGKLKSKSKSKSMI